MFNSQFFVENYYILLIYQDVAHDFLFLKSNEFNRLILCVLVIKADMNWGYFDGCSITQILLLL